MVGGAGGAGATSTATATAGGATVTGPLVSAGGSAICQMDESPSTSQSYTPQQDAGTPLLSISVHCPSCKDEFCALCKKAVSLRELTLNGMDLMLPIYKLKY